MMRTSICAVAKNENSYINEWVSYHLNLGFDSIYLYDNNDKETQSVDNYINKYDLEKVNIIDWHAEEMHLENQVSAYNNFIDEYAQEYDWCAFIDIDEFIVLNVQNIQEFLSKAPDGSNILLNWKVYGDDDVVEGDESIPVRERFVIPKVTNQWGVYRSIVNFKVNKEYHACSPHHFSTELCDDIVCRDCNFNKVKYFPDFIYGSYNDLMRYPCYIAHYQTKTISEFLKYKFNRAPGYFTGSDYFFQINDKTPEKEEYIRKFLESNGLSYE